MVDKMEGGQTNKLKFNVTGMGKKNKNFGADSSPNKKFKKNKDSGEKKDKGHDKENKAEKREKKVKKYVQAKQDANTNFTPVAKKKVYTDEEKKAFIEKTKKV